MCSLLCSPALGPTGHPPVCAQILTPVQNALCIVRAYPYVPDSAALATCLAARCGCQSARERLSVKRHSRATPS